MMKIIKYFLYIIFALTLNLKAQFFYPTEQIDRHVWLVSRTNQPQKHMYWKINQIKQDPPKSWCQTTCTSMLLSLMNIFLPPSQIEYGTTGGTKPPTMSHIVSFLNRNNIPFFMARFEPRYSPNPSLILEYAKDLCDKGAPPYILAYRHAYIIAGYNNKRQEVYMIDPNKDKQILVYTFANFNKWISNSPDYTQIGQVFFAHKPAQPNRFFYLPQKPKEVSRVFLMNQGVYSQTFSR